MKDVGKVILTVRVERGDGEVHVMAVFSLLTHR